MLRRDNLLAVGGVEVGDGKFWQRTERLMAREEFDAFAAGATTRLYRTAVLMVGDHYLAEDLVQDVLARMYVAWPQINGDPHGYAYRAIAYAVANQRRWMGRHPEAPLPDDDVRAATTSLADTIVIRDEMLSALRQLPPRQRVIIVLRYYVDLTEVETASALQISVGTVKSQHSRAVTTLRSLLNDDLVLAHVADSAHVPPLGTSEPLPLTDGSTP